jgi:hypothetical protein
MSDIYCAKCGEPWDAYGVRNGDTEPAEAAKFLRGSGCPTCAFGTKCPSCNGTGKNTCTGSCQTCHGTRRVLARRLLFERNAVRRGSPNDQSAAYRYGYIPHVKVVPHGAVRSCTSVVIHPSADGPFEEVWFQCWECWGSAPSCEECGGDGKLRRKGDAFSAMASECEASDEDPVPIMHRRGF